MESLVFNRLLALSLALFTGCAGSSGPTEHRTPESTAASALPSFCEAVDAALGESGAERGFRCLKVPNFLVTGFYGTRENPERSDFSNACFAGQALGAERLRMAVRPAGELRLSLRSERRLSEGGRLDLGFLWPWAPRVAASTASHESVEIAVELDDAEIRVLSSVAEILGQQYLESE